MIRKGLIAAVCATATFAVAAPGAGAQVPPECEIQEGYAYCQGGDDEAQGFCEGWDYRYEAGAYEERGRGLGCGGESQVVRGDGQCSTGEASYADTDGSWSVREEGCRGEVAGPSGIGANGHCRQGGWTAAGPAYSSEWSYRHCSGRMDGVGEGLVQCNGGRFTGEEFGACFGVGYLGITGGYIECGSEGMQVPVETPVRDETLVAPSEPPECARS